MTLLSHDAQAVSAHFDGAGRAWLAFGDGMVLTPGGEARAAHDGAVLCSAEHPSGRGVLTGGDDGRVCWTTTEGVQQVAARPGRWIDAVAASPASKLFAYACAREVHGEQPTQAASAASDHRNLVAQIGESHIGNEQLVCRRRRQCLMSLTVHA